MRFAKKVNRESLIFKEKYKILRDGKILSLRRDYDLSKLIILLKERIFFYILRAFFVLKIV